MAVIIIISKIITKIYTKFMCIILIFKIIITLPYLIKKMKILEVIISIII